MSVWDELDRAVGVLDQLRDAGVAECSLLPVTEVLERHFQPRRPGFEIMGQEADPLDVIDYYRRCLEDVQDGRPVRDLAEAKANYDQAFGHLRRVLDA